MPYLKTLGIFLALTFLAPEICAKETDDVEKNRLNAQWLADFAAMRQLNELGQTAENEQDWLKAAKYYSRASQYGENVPGPIGMWVDFAALKAYANAGDSKALNTFMRKVANRGFRFPEYIEGNPVFSQIKDETYFKHSLEQIKTSANAYRIARSNPEDAKLVFDDVPRFWAALDLAATKKYASQKAAIYRQHYLAEGSPGLIDYHWFKTKTMERLINKIDASPQFYAGIREQTLRAASFEPQIRDGFRKLKALYPDAYFPDVTFVIGRLNSGGTAGPSGMLIGLDVWSWTKGTSLDGISPGFQKILKSSNLQRLPYIVIHEHIHSLQAYTGKSSLLRGAIQEGSADFLALKVMPEVDLPAYFVWGKNNEEQIWNRFKKEMNGTDHSNWIGNNNADPGSDWHADLGYFIGAQISKAYYEQSTDKRQAIKDLLFVNDAQVILQQSGYANKFEK